MESTMVQKFEDYKVQHRNEVRVEVRQELKSELKTELKEELRNELREENESQDKKKIKELTKLVEELSKINAEQNCQELQNRGLNQSGFYYLDKRSQNRTKSL